MTIDGCVERIVYRSSESGYTVFELSATGEKELVTCVGSFSFINEGDYLKLEGSYVKHQVYGQQFSVTSYDMKEPEDAAAMEMYLASGAIKGVGKKTASNIVKMFGDDTFRIIEEEPEQLTRVKGISERSACAIAEQFNEKHEQRQEMMFLQQYGITSALAVKIQKQYGKGMYEILRKNPYKLAEDISGVGFKTVDEIAARIGIFGNSEFRIRAGLMYALSEASANGHTYLPVAKLFEYTANLLSIDNDDMQRELDKLLIERRVIDFRNENDEYCVYSAVFYYMELNTARMLHDLNVRYEVIPEKLEMRVRSVEKSFELNLDDLQRTAVAEAARNGVFILTGGPGTGKTTTINAIIKFFEAEGLDILLAAPTGRAAKRIYETTGYEASTIHRLLELKPNMDMSDQKSNSSAGYTFERNETNPLEADVVIIDEMSMVDISLMHALLKAINIGTRLILVGDVNQLPSVGPGNVLRDIIASKRFNVVKLTKIFRQASVSDIVVNAHKINNGEELSLDNQSKDFFFMQRNTADDIAGLVVALVRDKLPGYIKTGPLDIQVLTPMRKGELGVERLNTVMQHYLNPPDASKSEKEYRSVTFREGDKVMQVKNNYQIEWEVRNRKGYITDAGTGIFNGDCGIIKEINIFSEEMLIEFDESRMVVYPFSMLDELELAYAVTIHKSQGSEYPAVVLPLLTGPSMLFNRNLLYTAVTRAKTCVMIVGSRETVARMIQNADEQKRYSGLAQHIREMK